MAERLDDRDLERTLSDIGTRLGGTKRDLWPAVRTRIAERRARPWWSRLSIERGTLAPVAYRCHADLPQINGCQRSRADPRGRSGARLRRIVPAKDNAWEPMMRLKLGVEQMSQRGIIGRRR